jgi:hypothetical protein
LFVVFDMFMDKTADNVGDAMAMLAREPFPIALVEVEVAATNWCVSGSGH